MEWQLCHMKGNHFYASLTSMPMYKIGFYLLHEGTHQKLDSIRGRFLQEGLWNKKRYHGEMGSLDRPKEFDWLGFIDTKTTNIALLTNGFTDQKVERLVYASKF